MSSHRFMCPFCAKVIVETSWPDYDLLAVESTLYEHLADNHPIRWRLTRKYRRAMKASAHARSV